VELANFFFEEGVAMKKLRPRLSFLLILAVPLITLSCGQGGSPTSPISRLRQVVTGLTLSVTTSQGAGSMTFRINVENGGSATETLNFTCAQFFDIEVTDQSGKLVWRWSNDKYFAAVLWSLELSPGESSAQETVWNLTGSDQKPLSSGSYTAKIYITSSPRDGGLSSVIRLTI